MSQALARMHMEMGANSPFYDNVAQAECSEIDSCFQVSGGYICIDGSYKFVVSDLDYSGLVEKLDVCSSEPAKLIGLAIQRGLYNP